MYYFLPGVLPDILPLCVALPSATWLPVVCGGCVQPDSSRLLGRSAAYHARRTARPGCHCKLLTLFSKYYHTGHVYAVIKHVHDRCWDSSVK